MGFAYSVLLISLMLFSCFHIALRYFFQEGKGVSADAVSTWVLGITLSLFLERYLVSLINSNFIRIILALVIFGMIAVICFEIQERGIPFLGFPNKWAYVVVAIVTLIFHELWNEPVPTKSNRKKS